VPVLPQRCDVDDEAGHQSTVTAAAAVRC
jgi:hypothetical protein